MFVRRDFDNAIGVKHHGDQQRLSVDRREKTVIEAFSPPKPVAVAVYRSGRD
jgi:hypothetical protein